MKMQLEPLGIPSGIEPSNWNSWTWQFKNGLLGLSDFQRFFELSKEEGEVFSRSKGVFNIRVTPYYAYLASISPALRPILIPSSQELQTHQGQQLFDPLGERKHSPVGRIIHRYPDRVLFLVTDICSVYCRYCTRKHFTGQDQAFLSSKEYQEALEYIRKSKGIREVILSGGDPLTLSDQKLQKVFEDLTAINHVELIRLGTRMPVVCPMRITPDLVQMLKQYHPVYIMNHFNHPKEITGEAERALSLLADHGFPLLNQMVLLNGVNNHSSIVQALSRRLLRLRVKPYYMFQCDPSQGTDHLRTSVEESLEIQKELWGRLSGLAMPHLSLDIPDGGGKVGLVPNFEISRQKGIRKYQGWDGVEADYVNPAPAFHRLPPDWEDYEEEWKAIQNQVYGSLKKL